MTRNPPRLQELEEQFESRVGPYWQGTVGDRFHRYGYHLGADEVPYGDYSIVLARDVAGVRKYGGSWASAVDVGMGWSASRMWLRRLVNDFLMGRRGDIREIIGSVDGTNSILWDGPSRDYWEHDGEPHVSHTHISFYRDSIFRSHTYLFDGWTARGPVVKPVPKPSPVRTPTPELIHVTPPVGDNTGSVIVGPRTLILAAGAGGLAWIIKRRMERSREDSG